MYKIPAPYALRDAFGRRGARRYLPAILFLSLVAPMAALAAQGDRSAAPSKRWTRSSVEAEVRARADSYLSRKQLIVDYCRIGRKLAIPLAFRAFPEPHLPVPGIPDYPWEIRRATAGTVGYSWHGSAEAAWQVRDNWVMISAAPDATIWFTSPSFSITDAAIDRLPGSRGQLTLSVQRDTAPAIWWVFCLGGLPPAMDVDPGGRWIRVDGVRLGVD